jgi:hypothetical protein
LDYSPAAGCPVCVATWRTSFVRSPASRCSYCPKPPPGRRMTPWPPAHPLASTMCEAIQNSRYARRWR